MTLKRIFAFISFFLLIFAAGSVLASSSEDHKCFSTVDGDQDGKITPAELTKAYPSMKQQGFQALDKNKDGLLNHDEYHDALGHGLGAKKGNKAESKTQ